MSCVSILTNNFLITALKNCTLWPVYITWCLCGKLCNASLQYLVVLVPASLLNVELLQFGLEYLNINRGIIASQAEAINI